MTKKPTEAADEDLEARRAVEGEDASAEEDEEDDREAERRDADEEEDEDVEEKPAKKSTAVVASPSTSKKVVRKSKGSKSTKDKKKPESKARRFGRDVLSLLIFLGVALSARASLADHYVVPTGSMIPTVEEGDRVFVSKAAYGFRIPLSATWLARWGEPQRGDVVVLQSPVEDVVLLKRVVAVGGDEVRVQGGRLILNGKPVISTDTEEELGGKSHRVSLKSGGGPDFGPEKVPEGKVLVMGDNRGNSKDGRMFGFVDESSVLGRAVAIYLRDGSLVWDEL